MSREYRDIDELLETSTLDDKLYLYDDLMKCKPNFDKTEGSKKVYQRKEYTIYQVKKGFIIHNTRYKFERAHTHIKSFLKAKSLIDLAVRKKLPNTPKKWEIECLIRICKDKKYIDKLNDVLGGEINEFK